MNHEDVQAYSKIITKTVYDSIRMYNLPSSTDANDLSQICWVKILEYNERKGKFPDYKLAKKMCSDAIKDYIGYEQNRNHISTDVDEEGDRADWNIDYDNNVEREVEVSELANMFPKGSKERLFIDFYLAKSGVRYTGVVPPNGREQNGFTKGNLARMLGFTSASDRGFRKFSSQMKELIADYYGR